MNKRQQFTLALIGMALSAIMFLVMVIETISPTLLPEAPGWLSSISILACVCLPLLFCSLLQSRVPTYKIGTWSSDTPSGIGIIMIGASILITAVAVPLSFLPTSIKDLPEARTVYLLSALLLLSVIGIEALVLRSWTGEFYEELYPG